MNENLSNSAQRRPIEGQAVERIKTADDRNSGDLSSSQGIVHVYNIIIIYIYTVNLLLSARGT